MPKPLTHAQATARFATIDVLHEFGVTMMVQKFRAQHPTADENAIHAMTLDWLGHSGSSRPPGVGLGGMCNRVICVEKNG